jgi:hypothetical protein
LAGKALCNLIESNKRGIPNCFKDVVLDIHLC